MKKPAAITSDNITTNKNNYPPSDAAEKPSDSDSSPLTTSPPQFEAAVASSSSSLPMPVIVPPPTWGSSKCEIHYYCLKCFFSFENVYVGNPYAAAMAERTQAMSIDWMNYEQKFLFFLAWPRYLRRPPLTTKLTPPWRLKTRQKSFVTGLFFLVNGRVTPWVFINYIVYTAPPFSLITAYISVYSIILLHLLKTTWHGYHWDCTPTTTSTVCLNFK